jgi:hypothetical protein
MELFEVPSESKITITLKQFGQERVFKTRAITSYNNALLVEPIYFAGLPLAVTSSAELRVESAVNGSVHFFHANSITQVNNWGGIYHLIDGVPSQRPGVQRRGERFKLEMLGKAAVGLGNYYNVLIHDISFQGISFMLGAGMTCKVGDKVHIRFTPKDALNEIKIDAVVKRLFKTGGDFMAAGCMIEGYNSAVAGYIFNHRNSNDSVRTLIGENKDKANK